MPSITFKTLVIPFIMKPKSQISLFVYFLFLISCSQNRSIISSETKTIVVPQDFNKPFLTESMIENLRIVPLETNEYCLIGEIDQIIVYNNKYFLADVDNKTLFVFDYNGKFLFKIHSIGRGPEEYYELRDFKINSEGNILILDFKRIVCFDSTGKYLRSLRFNRLNERIDLNPLQFVPLNTGGYFFWQGSFGARNNQQNNKYCLYEIFKNRVKSQHFKLERSIFGGFNRFYQNLNNDYYMQTFRGNDTVYSISDQGVKPSYFIDFGERAIPKGLLPNGFDGVGKVYENLKQMGYCYNINNILEGNHFIHFTFTCKEGFGIALYSFSTSTISVGTYLFNNIPISIMFRGYNKDKDEFILILSDYEVSVLNNEQNINEKQFSTFDKQIMQALKTKDELSNPYLLVYKLKDF